MIGPLLMIFAVLLVALAIVRLLDSGLIAASHGNKSASFSKWFSRHKNHSIGLLAIGWALLVYLSR